MTFTREQAADWVAENRERLTRDRIACDDPAVRMMERMSPQKSIDAWDSGCWLAHVLGEQGATAEQIRQMQFANGQWAFMNGGDFWSGAIETANEFLKTLQVPHKPGAEYADELIEETLKRR